MSSSETPAASSALATVRLGSGQKSRVRIRGFQLEVGPSGRAVRFNNAAVRVGKGEGCDLVLDDPAASRTHLLIEETPEDYQVRDLDSTNGTLLDGVRIREALLVPGSTLTVGATALRFDHCDREVPVLPAEEDRFHGLVGRSAAMKELFGHLRLVAATQLSVVLLGETGCGKEVAARALHDASPRARGAFTVFDCGSIDRELVGAALFGHREGAYTGAAQARKGAFQSSSGGTLFLDEIGDLPLDVQSRLLRALERREIQPLGSDQVLKVDVRVISATHRDLEAMARGGTFRADLLFRLSGLVLELPPLRQRRADILPLALHFLEQVRPQARLTPAAAAAIESHSWPGNVRELRNVVERAAALTRADVLDAPDIRIGTLKIGGSSAPPSPPAVAEPPPGATPMSLAEAERAAVLNALRAAGGNKSQAARILGIARKTLREKMDRFGLRDDSSDE